METTQPIVTFTESQIKYHQGRLDKMSGELNGDFEYYLPWKAEEMYNTSVRIKEYKKWLNTLNDLGSDKWAAQRFIDIQLESYDEFLDYASNVDGSSTNQVNNLCVTWKYKVILELRSVIRGWKKNL